MLKHSMATLHLRSLGSLCCNIRMATLHLRSLRSLIVVQYSNGYTLFTMISCQHSSFSFSCRLSVIRLHVVSFITNSALRITVAINCFIRLINNTSNWPVLFGSILTFLNNLTSAGGSRRHCQINSNASAASKNYQVDVNLYISFGKQTISGCLNNLQLKNAIT